MSNKTVNEEEDTDVFGTSCRRSDNSLSLDINSLSIDDEDEDGSENIDATDHYDDKGLYSLRSKPKLPRSQEATSQVVDGTKQDKEGRNIEFLQNDTDDNRSLSFNVPQFIGLT